MAILIFLVVHWYFSLFCQTFFLHRYASHGMFKMHISWEKFFHLFTYLCQGSSYLVPRAYGVLHRMHHAYSDTEKDPHSPHFHQNLFAMMWETSEIYNNLLIRKFTPEKRFTDGLPEWSKLDAFGNSWASRILWIGLYTTFYVLFVPAGMWYLYLLLPLHFLMGPVHGAIVNWAGHKYGYRNYASADHSKNTLAFDLLAGGELFQNNHHRFPNRPNFATQWFELDPTFPVIKMLNWLSIIRLPLSVPTGKTDENFLPETV